MRALIRCLLMLSLLCTLMLGAVAAHACHPAAAAPQAAGQPDLTFRAHHPPAAGAPVTPAQPSLQFPCNACSACAGHCPGLVAGAPVPLAGLEGGNFQARALPAPAGIVLAPEPRPPRA